jgi:hypothetical protein
MTYYYIGIAMVTAHLLFLILKRPYDSKLSNLSLVFNEISILFCYFWVLSKGTPFDNIQNTTILVYTFIGILCVVNLLGIIRSVVAIREEYFVSRKAKGSDR